MSEEQIAEIAAGLTKAQRRSIASANMTHPNIGGEPFVTVDITCQPWPQGVATFLTLNTDRLTPLGLRVRQHLLADARP